MARRGKFARLVADFVATVEEQGGAVDRQTVTAELQARIEAIATQVGVTPQTVLRSYIGDDWGRQAASTMMAKVQRSDPAAGHEGDPEFFHPQVVARLLAALGQATLYAATNDDQRQPVPQLNLRLAAEAVTGLSLALHETSPGEQLVAVGSEVVAWTRITLETLRDQLRDGKWTFCPCGEQHGQRDTDTAVLAAVSEDLLFLPTMRPQGP